jgi:hypothetical protein
MLSTSGCLLLEGCGHGSFCHGAAKRRIRIRIGVGSPGALLDTAHVSLLERLEAIH